MKKMNILMMLSLVGLIATVNVNAQKRGEFHIDQSYAIESNGTLYLDSDDAKVTITGSDRTDAHVKIDRVKESKGFSSRSAEFKVDVESRNGSLYVRERSRNGVSVQVGYSRTDYSIDIALPLGVSLKIKGDDDDYVIRNIEGRISMETEDGDIELIDCNSKDLRFEIEDGDLKIDGGSGSISIDIEDGDVDLRGGAFDRMELTTEDGNLILETSIADNGIYDIKAEDSRIDFIVTKGGGEFLVLKDDGSLRASTDFEMIEESDNRSIVRLAGGSAKIEIRTDDGRVRLSKQ
jgi:hypothetical protein